MERQYKVEMEPVNNAIFSANSNCNEIMFVNLSANTVLINKFPLVANLPLGTFITFGGNADEMDRTVYTIEGATGNFYIFRKKYM